MFYRTVFKPVADFGGAFLLLLLLWPIIIITMFLLAIENRGKVLFFQKRPGLNAKPFYIIKLKTMRDTVDNENLLLSDEARLTVVGRFVRSLSLDELMQLFNVLNGDMSLVGPRPLLMKYLDRYTIDQSSRHLVKPGITGWAQVNGRNGISWEEKFQLDKEYISKQSFCLDTKILLRTVVKVCSRKGINSDGNATMEEFTGGE